MPYYKTVVPKPYLNFRQSGNIIFRVGRTDLHDVMVRLSQNVVYIAKFFIQLAGKRIAISYIPVLVYDHQSFVNALGQPVMFLRHMSYCACYAVIALLGKVEAFTLCSLFIYPFFPDKYTDHPSLVFYRFHSLDDMSILLRDRFHLFSRYAELKCARNCRLILRFSQKTHYCVSVRRRHIIGFCFCNNYCVLRRRRAVNKNICILEIC